MGLLGIDGAGMVKKAASIFERDKSDPYTILDVDRFLNTGAIALPLVILAIAIFLGGDMYNVNGLAVFNPNFQALGRGYRHYETWNQMPYIRRHCWAELGNTQCEEGIFRGDCKNLELLHYSIVPYFLFAIFIVMYTVKALWNIGKATEMANKVNYLITGFEEVIRDILECLIKSANETSQPKPKPRKSSRSRSVPRRSGELRASLVSKRNSTDSQNTSYNVKSFQWSKLLRKNARPDKFTVLNGMMEKYAKQHQYTTFYTLTRTYFVVLIGIVNVGTWFLYLDIRRNPISFECPLPSWLFYEDTVDNRTETFTTVKAVFEPVARRTLLMYIMFAIYCVIILASVVGWIKADSYNPGMELLKNLPSINQHDGTGFNDLRYLMKLVYTNRKRVKFLRLAFDTMIAIKQDGESDEIQSERFFAALREISIWSITNESAGELNKIINRTTEIVKKE